MQYTIRYGHWDEKEIDWSELELNQIGMRMLIYLGVDENGEDYGDPPSLGVDICGECYFNQVDGNESEWEPMLNRGDQFQLKNKTIENLLSEGNSWEWWDGCVEVFKGSEYKCNECKEELLEGAWDLGDTFVYIWHEEYNRAVAIR